MNRVQRKQTASGAAAREPQALAIGSRGVSNAGWFTAGAALVNDESDERFCSGAMKGVDRSGTRSGVEVKPEIA